MLKRILPSLFLLTAVFAHGDAFSQETVIGKWWHNPIITKRVNLERQERKLLDEKFLEAQRRLIALKNGVEREQFELEHLIEKETLNEDAIMAQFRKLEKAREDLSSERFRFLLEVRKIMGLQRFQMIKMASQGFNYRAPVTKAQPGADQ
jgi:Spy/CpxP family protein refolding chaperone